MTRIQAIRESEHLVVFVVFTTISLDMVLVYTTLQIQPFILADIYHCPLHQNQSDCEEFSKNLPILNGILLAVGPLMDCIANMPVAIVVHRYGHKIPMMSGLVLSIVAALSFGFAPSFALLIVARLGQSVGSMLSVVAGLSLLSSRIVDDEARSRATGRALAGFSIGALVGSPFGAILYQHFGREAPYIILAGLLLIDGFLRLLAKDVEDKQDVQQATLKVYVDQLKDYQIAITLFCNFLSKAVLGGVRAMFPQFLAYELRGEVWQIGVISAIAMCFQIGSQLILSSISPSKWLWAVFMFAMTLMFFSVLAYTLCTDPWSVIGPESLLRSSLGLVVGTVGPLLGYLATLRHDSNYSPAFSLYITSDSLGLLFGSLAQGFLITSIHYDWTFVSLASLAFIAVPLTIFLRTGDVTSVKKRNDHEELKGINSEKKKVEEGEELKEIEKVNADEVPMYESTSIDD